jgi:hypothetical protein
MFINKTSYMELRSVWWVSSWLAVCSPINCMFSNWLESSACLLHHFLLCSGPKCNAIYLLDWNTTPDFLLLPLQKLLWNLKLVRREKG